MKGKENPTNQYDTLEIVETTPVEQVMYEPNHPMFGGDEASLGTCNAG
jgi:branched-chain amino acid transport system substrate-binding protein